MVRLFSRRTLASSLIAFSGALGVFQLSSTCRAETRRTASARRAYLLSGKLGPYQRSVGLPEDVPGSGGARASQATGLSFHFRDGWGNYSDMRDSLANFLRINQPNFVAVYGDPAPAQQGKTVEIDNAPGGYAPPGENSTGPGVIRIDATKDPVDIVEAKLTPMVLAAYHGRAIFNVKYTNDDLRVVEPWEFGFEDAATLLILNKSGIATGTFDPSQYTFAYVMGYYDYLNRPGLGNLFYNGGFGIADIRAAMAQSAWLKVAAESPTFFADFNSKYYAAFTADQTVAGNLNSLTNIAAQVVPTVENQNFNDWIRRQYALDASVTPGEKLYVGIAPAYKEGFGDGTMGVFVEHVETAPDGTETPLAGSIGSLAVFDETGADVSNKSPQLTSSNTFQITTSLNSADHPGEFFGDFDFSGVGTTDKALLTVKVRMNALDAKGYFPHNVTGTNNTKTASGYCGGVIGGASGTLGIKIAGGASASTTVARGVWQQTITYPQGPAVKTTFTLGGKTFVRNTTWWNTSDSAVRLLTFLFDGTSTTGNFTMTIPSGASTLRMISVPVYPSAGDEADVLGVPKDTLKLARYRPNLSAQPVGEGSLPYGIGGDRHELYPYISAPMGPGRGYWLGVDGGSTRTIAGAEPPKTGVFEVPLVGSWAPKDATDLTKGMVETGGWNQIGVPFNRVYAPDAIKVRYGGFAPVPFSTAVSRGWVGAAIWRWLPAGGYEDMVRTSQKLQPFEGYYVYTQLPHGVYLVFDPNAAAAATAAPAGWKVAITAATSANRDRSNSLGVSAERVPAAKPPTGSRVVTLRFLSGGSDSADSSGAGAATGWADSFLPTMDKTGTWTFLVDGTKSGQTVTLSWPDLSGLPSDVKLRLVDTVNLKATAMTSGRSYAFTSKGTPRKFRVEATRMALPSLTVANAPSSGYSITLKSNVAFSGNLEVRSGGAVVVTLKSGDFNAGKTVFTWDGKDAAGKKVAPGVYRIWIVPAEGTGTEAKAVLEIG